MSNVFDDEFDPGIYTEGLKTFVAERYEGIKAFEDAFNEYVLLPDFAPDGNITDLTDLYDKDTQQVVRLSTQYYLTKAFQAMKVDLNNPNVKELSEEGNIGTPGRIAKVWCGSSLSDDAELGCGRWTKKPRIASFPNTNTNTDIPITKRIDIISNCSHHGITFSTLARPDSYAYISYVPDAKVLGISKLQRLANWVSKRFWLQEDLTKALYDQIVEAADTESVYVKIVNAVHGCESFRGSQSNDGAFSSEMYGGKFSDPELRKEVDRSL